MKKNIIGAGLAGGVTFFLLGFIFYGVLLKNFYETQTTLQGVNKEQPDFIFLILGNLIISFLLAIILGQWVKATSAMEGAKTGLLLGILMGSGFDLIMYSTTNIMTMTGVLADIVVLSVMWAVVGLVQGAIFSSSKKATA